MVAVILMLVGMGATADPAFIPFFWLWLIAVVCRRFEAFKPRKQGIFEHSL